MGGGRRAEGQFTSRPCGGAAPLQRAWGGSGQTPLFLRHCPSSFVSSRCGPRPSFLVSQQAWVEPGAAPGVLEKPFPSRLHGPRVSRMSVAAVRYFLPARRRATCCICRTAVTDEGDGLSNAFTCPRPTAEQRWASWCPCLQSPCRWVGARRVRDFPLPVLLPPEAAWVLGPDLGAQ